jgi:hypothetical protein
MLDNPEYYKKNKKMYGYIEELTPEEYMKRCAELHKSSYTQQMQHVDKEVIYRIVKDIKENHTKMYLPMLDYRINSQEGRHRAMIAKELGLFHIPVLIVKEYKGVSEEYVTQAKLPFMNGDFPIYVNPTMKEIRSIIKDYDVRFVIDTKNNKLYIWSEMVLHSYVADILERKKLIPQDSYPWGKCLLWGFGRGGENKIDFVGIMGDIDNKFIKYHGINKDGGWTKRYFTRNAYDDIKKEVLE